MNPLAALSDHDLLIKTKALVGEEKRITQEVLNHLEEIEYRKVYLVRGYSSLLEYCVTELKYSETSAKRRTSAMWLIRKIPQAKEKLESGSVNLSTLTQLNSFLRREEKIKTYTPEMKLDLLSKIENKSQDQCEREFIKISPLEISYKEKQRPLTEEFTQMTFVASNALKAKLDLLKNLTAHKNSNPTMAELIEMSVDMALEKLNPIKTSAQKNVSSEVKVEEVVKPKSELEVEGSSLKKETGSLAVLHRAKKLAASTRYISQSIRQHVWKRDEGQCQYTHEETNKKCQSKFALQIDHIHPFSLGGSNETENLRLLCRAHNSWRTKGFFNQNISGTRVDLSEGVPAR